MLVSDGCLVNGKSLADPAEAVTVAPSSTDTAGLVDPVSLILLLDRPQHIILDPRIFHLKKKFEFNLKS